MDTINAWLVDIDDEREIVESWDDVLSLLDEEGLTAPAAHDMAADDVIRQVANVNEDEIDIVPLTLDADFDHGQRPADELTLLVGQQAAYLLAWALFQGLTGIAATPDTFGSVDEAFTAATGFETFAGWIEDPDDAQALTEWAERMEAECAGAGWIILTNADSGMTWFYRPVPMLLQAQS